MPTEWGMITSNGSYSIWFATAISINDSPEPSKSHRAPTLAHLRWPEVFNETMSSRMSAFPYVQSKAMRVGSGACPRWSLFIKGGGSCQECPDHRVWSVTISAINDYWWLSKRMGKDDFANLYECGMVWVCLFVASELRHPTPTPNLHH